MVAVGQLHDYPTGNDATITSIGKYLGILGDILCNENMAKTKALFLLKQSGNQISDAVK